MRKKLFFSSAFVLALVLIGASVYSLPYYISKPGMAKDLKPIISVKGGNKDKGNFMLTTVRMGQANIYSYAEAKMSKYEEIYPINEIMEPTETDEEYNVRQLYYMKDAKLNATDVAYHKAGLPVSYKYNGIYVLSVLPGMPADGKLVAGDRIFKVDGRAFSSSKQFMDYVSTKKSGDELTFTYVRKNKTYDVKVQVKPFKQAPKRVGIGITLVDDKVVSVNPPVKIVTDEIGGPSAGLMFSLEIYNQLTKDDLTRGHQIAGTGTISPDGSVGPIGGIEQKIVAADKAGAEIFLAPNEHGAKDSNYRDALKAAHDIGTKMKIIPVDTFDEAVAYLKKLPEK